MSINCAGEVGLSVPNYFPIGLAEQFLRKKADWIIGVLGRFENNKPKLFFKNSRRDYLEKKENALALVEERLNYFNSFYNFPIGGITIKNQKSRWGSCSSKGNLNFNYKIVYLPEVLADYIVVHELCHLKEMNHSSRFWARVAEMVPDWKERRKQLKKRPF